MVYDVGMVVTVDGAEFYTGPEMAERAGVTTARIRQLCLTGKVPARKIARDWLIPVDAAEAWIASDTRKRFGAIKYRERHLSDD